MNYIRAKNGRLYPANRIVSIGPFETPGGECITEVELEGCGLIEFHSNVIREFLREPTHVIAAQPETYIVRSDEEAVGGFWKMLVIGWGTGRDGRLYPITSDGVNDGTDEDLCVLTPDGRVSHPELGSWETVEVFLAEERRTHRVAA